MRNLADALGVAHHAGVRRVHRVGSHRADEARHGADLGGAAGAVEAVLDGLPVGRERGVEEHDLANRLVLPSRQLVERADDEHVGLDAFGRRADAAAEPEHPHRLPARLDEHELLLAPHPARHHHVLAVDVFEAVGLHLRQDPVDGLFEAGAAAEAVAERVAEVGQTVEAAAVFERGVDDRIGGPAVGFDGKRLGRGRRPEGRQRHEREHTKQGHGSSRKCEQEVGTKRMGRRTMRADAISQPRHPNRRSSPIPDALSYGTGRAETSHATPSLHHASYRNVALCLI